MAEVRIFNGSQVEAEDVLTCANGLEREAARMTSEWDALVASIAQARGRIAKTQLQVLQIDETLQQEVATELREVEGSIGEFEERRVAALDQLKRVDLRRRRPTSSTISRSTRPMP